MRRIVIVLVATCVVAAPASAHKRDLMRAGKRVGPIKLYETTLREAKRWFGEPTSRRVERRGCVRNVVRLRWPGLKVYAGKYRGETAPIAEVHVSSPTITSARHGELAIHTRRYVRVGDSEAKVRRKYPGVKGETHRGHTHYIVEDDYDRVMVRVEERTVVKLEARPFEWC